MPAVAVTPALLNASVKPPCTALLLVTPKVTTWLALVSVIEGAVIVSVVLSSLLIVP